MSALANETVGSYLNEHFVSTYVKVGTFALVNGQKQGGNVASYFCLPDGRVLHASAGPADASLFLSESKWAVHVHKLAAFDGLNDPARFKEAMSKVHAQRLQAEFGVRQGLVTQINQLARKATADGGEGNFADRNDPVTAAKLRGLMKAGMNTSNAGKVHLLLALFPLVKVQDVYKYVFEHILNEKVSSLPVLEITGR